MPLVSLIVHRACVKKMIVKPIKDSNNGPQVIFSRLRQQLHEPRQNLSHANKLTEVLAKAHFSCWLRVSILPFVMASCHIVTASLLLPWYRAFFDSRRQYEGNTTTWSPHNIVVYKSYYSTIVSRRDHGFGKDCQILVDVLLVASFIK